MPWDNLRRVPTRGMRLSHLIGVFDRIPRETGWNVRRALNVPPNAWIDAGSPLASRFETTPDATRVATVELSLVGVIPRPRALELAP